jgi:DNA-binding response OmpR family regulator
MSDAKKKILIVEDERPLAHALELKLTREGFECHSAFSGQEGVTESVSGKYDLILLDIIMPEVDGFMLLQELQAKHIKTPVIIVSNLGQQEDVEKAKALGAKEYFVKANSPLTDIVKKVKEELG